jgi:hypothetical protein
MSGGWWQENNPNPAEMRQLIQHLQSELARAHQELAMLRGQRQQINSAHMHQPSRFRFIPDSLTWYEHDANARRMGGHLATIHSGAENREVQAAARGQTIWIGGLRHGHRNGHGVDSWRWSSGERWFFINWNVGEPNNSGGHENAVQMYSNGKWNDVRQDWKGPAVYEFPHGY